MKQQDDTADTPDAKPVRVYGRPFPPGVSGNPGGVKTGLGEVRSLAREKSPRAVERLCEWIESDNAKASVPACVAVYEIAWGRIGSQKDLGASDPSTSKRIDLSRLSSEELAQFRALAMKAKASGE